MDNQKELIGILNSKIIEYFNLNTSLVYIGKQNEEHINEKGADLLCPIHRTSLLFKDAGKQHGQECNPDILAAEEGAAHLRKPSAVRRHESAE